MTSPWYRDFFDESYLVAYEALVTPQQTRREVDRILALLDLEPHKRVLDIPCGAGRHSVELSRRGYRVIGVDLSETLLHAGRLAAARANVSVQFIRADMREVRLTQPVDAAINLYTAIGYLESEEEDARALAAVRRNLHRGAPLLLETVNLFALLHNGKPGLLRTWYEVEGRYALEDARYDPVSGRLRLERTLLHGGESQHKAMDVRLYTPRELIRLLEASGFAVDAVYGDLDQRPLEVESERVVILARAR